MGPVEPNPPIEIVVDANVSPRLQRALAKAERLVHRVTKLKRDLTDDRLDALAREEALVALEALVLVSRGSSEVDHRKQLLLAGLQAAAETYLVANAPQAALYASSADPAALLAEAALADLRDEYSDAADQFSNQDVARAVRQWAEK